MNIDYLNLAIKESFKSKITSDFPVGCVIVCDDVVIAKAHNRRNKTKKTIDHAEIIAICKANKLKNEWRIADCDMYLSMAPCDMCKNVIRESRIKNVYYLLEKDEIKSLCNNTKFHLINDDSINNKLTDKYIKIVHDFFTNLR